ncbi:mediator of RNA polymerase II transcription subunit 8 [Rhypophila decipiens]
MASLNLAPEELKQLEMMRNRFKQLSSSLDSLLRDVYNIQPLPSGESIQTSASILQQHIKSIQDISSENAHLLQRLVVHPSTNYPGRTQEGILLTLLRKKLEPEIEHWVEGAREAAKDAGIDISKLSGGSRFAGSGESGGTDEDDEDAYGYDPDAANSNDIFNEQWADIRGMCNDGIVDYITNQANEPYTVAERAMGTHNVRTGLRRNLEEDEDESEEEEEDDEDNRMDEDVMEISRPRVVPPRRPGAAAAAVGGIEGNQLQPEHMLWYLARGDVSIPPNLDMEYLRRTKEAAKRAGPGR